MGCALDKLFVRAGRSWFSAVLAGPTAVAERLNPILEPALRAGWAAPGGLGVGLVVVETRRRGGGRRRVPLFALELVPDRPLVVTGRGPRSRWVRDLRKDRRLRFWCRGVVRSARAELFGPRDGETRDDGLPEPYRWLTRALRPMTAFGWTIAVLVPSGRGVDPAAATRRAAPPGRGEARAATVGTRRPGHDARDPRP